MSEELNIKVAKIETGLDLMEKEINRMEIRLQCSVNKLEQDTHRRFVDTDTKLDVLKAKIVGVDEKMQKGFTDMRESHHNIETLLAEGKGAFKGSKLTIAAAFAVFGMLCTAAGYLINHMPVLPHP